MVHFNGSDQYQFAFAHLLIREVVIHIDYYCCVILMEPKSWIFHYGCHFGANYSDSDPPRPSDLNPLSARVRMAQSRLKSVCLELWVRCLQG